MPQEPSPIQIGYYTPNDFIIVIPKEDWAKLGGYIYDLQSWIRAAGPCIKTHGSDVPKPGDGAVKQ